MRAIIELNGKTFGSKIEITINMAERGGLHKGESIRIVEDLADQISQAVFRVRWETYETKDFRVIFEPADAGSPERGAELQK